jgi:hypothetical protein
MSDRTTKCGGKPGKRRKYEAEEGESIRDLLLNRLHIALDFVKRLAKVYNVFSKSNLNKFKRCMLLY